MSSSNRKVLITCPPMIRTFHEVASTLEQRGIEADCAEVVQVLSEDELTRLVPNYDAWIIGDDPATYNVLSAGKNGKLKACVKWGVGTDNVDAAAMEELSIPWANTPGMFGNEVADVALGYVIGLARSLFQIDRATREGKWIKPTGISLAGKNVALVGYGDIGQQTCNRLVACGMDVTIFDPALTPGQQMGDSCRVGEWPSDVEAHDFVVLTCALTPNNRHMLNAEVLAKCNGIRVVNVARGPLIDEAALVKALDDGSVESVALDVFEMEPLPMGSPLRKRPNTVFGSHNGSNTLDAVLKTNVRAIDLIDELLARGDRSYNV